ncbi:MAG: maleylpyruvate isomerase N-terminal domain-containing protein [Dehalococcoidia bacterium]
MDARVEQMAERFAHAHGELTSIAERCSGAEWQARCAAEGWPVGTVVYHVAIDYPALLDVLQAIATGVPPPSVTREQLDQRNAQHAQRCAGLSRQEILVRLQRNGEAITT